MASDQSSRKEFLKQIYSSVFYVTRTEHDFRMMCGTFHFPTDAKPGEKVEISASVTQEIIMPPRTAKQLMILLKRHIEEYEKGFGEIILEPQQE